MCLKPTVVLEIYTREAVPSILCVCGIRESFDKLRGYMTRIFPEKASQVLTETDSKLPSQTTP